MKLELRAYVEGRYFTGGAAVKIPELVARAFEPLKTTDEHTIARITSETVSNSETHRIVLKTREDAAEILAKELSILIIKEMSKNDTHNGYNLEDQ